jgi:hypothetical protein
MMIAMLQEPELVGALDLGRLPGQWKKVDLVLDRARTVAASRDGNVLDARAVDESRTGGHRLYPIVERHLAAAEDCHRALPKLLTSHGATQTAMWALLRAQFEASFFALWLLLPELSDGRVLRGIRADWLDDREAHKYQKELLDDPVTPIPDDVRTAKITEMLRIQDEHNRTYRAETAALGAKWRDPIGVNVIGEITSLEPAVFKEQRVLLRHAWRTLAGLQHGNLSALLRVSSQENAVTSPSGVTARLVPGDSPVQTIAGTTAALTMNACLRYMQCNQPSQQDRVIDLKTALRLRAEWKGL